MGKVYKEAVTFESEKLKGYSFVYPGRVSEPKARSKQGTTVFYLVTLKSEIALEDKVHELELVNADSKVSYILVNFYFQIVCVLSCFKVLLFLTLQLKEKRVEEKMHGKIS